MAVFVTFFFAIRVNDVTMSVLYIIDIRQLKYTTCY